MKEDHLLSHHFYAENRQRFMDALGDDAGLFFGQHHHLRNGDAEFPYRQSSDILYLSGWEDPEVAVLLRPKSDKPFIMFVQPKDPKREIWTGRRPGPTGAESFYGADAAYPFSELKERLPSLLQGHKRLHYRFAEDAANDRMLMQAVSSARRKGRENGLDFPEIFVDPSHILHRLRLVKSPKEIQILQKAADITDQAHRAAMAMTREGVFEYELESTISHVFRMNGGNGPGYTTIVGGGENAVILHYIKNDAVLQDGDLVCVDAGCEFGWYTADVTRTWPVNGKFTPAQKKLYEAVLTSQLKAIEAARVGNCFLDIHHAALRSLTESLVEFGFLEGDIEELIEEKKYQKWYMHGTSHWLGLDVHDVGPYGERGESHRLDAGMVLTIEPGLYVAPDDDEAPEEFRGMGIRIEDDILIAPEGPIVLTQAVPKTVAEIEAIVGNRS